MRPRRYPDDVLDSQRSATAPLRIALGFVYFHFGFLKLFPDLSPAEMLAGQTILRLGLDAEQNLAVRGLGIFECVLGVLLVFGVRPRWVVGLLLVHLAGTFVPLLVLPELAFKFAPFAPTLEGQYILKNLVFVAAAWTLLRDTRRPPDLSARSLAEEAP